MSVGGSEHGRSLDRHVLGVKIYNLVSWKGLAALVSWQETLDSITVFVSACVALGLAFLCSCWLERRIKCDCFRVARK